MENRTYTLDDVIVRKMETKPRPNGEDHRVQIVLEFQEALGGRFPSLFDAATDGSAPPILGLFRPHGGVLAWKSIELVAPRRFVLTGAFPDQPTEFAAILKTIKASAKWNERDGDVITYRLVLEKFPEPTLDGVIGYYLGRKAPNPITGTLSACRYLFQIEDHGTATPATIPAADEVD